MEKINLNTSYPKYNTRSTQKQLLDMPIEIIVKILKYFTKTELSITLSNTCLKLFEICQTLLKGRLTVLDHELKQLNWINQDKKDPMKMMRNVLETKEISHSMSYCIFHYLNYWTTDPRSLESTYEWLEINENLIDCETVQGSGIFFVLSSISSYKTCEIVLSKCVNLKHFYWHGEWPVYLENHLAKRVSLEFVSVKSPSFETYKTLPNLASNCEKLEYINMHIRHSYLSSCHWKLNVLGKNLQNLRHLSLSGTHNKYYEASLSKLFDSLQLFTLRLHEIGLGENTLRAIGDTQKDLVVLSLDDGKSVLTSEENSVINSLSYTIRKVESTKTALFDTGFADDLKMVFGEGIIDLSDYQLNDVVNVEYVSYILQRCSKLNNLTLRISVLGNNELLNIASYCHRLKAIDLKYNESVCDNILALICSSCNQLTKINLTECKNITDVGLTKLTEYCSALSSLNVSFCSQLTDNALENVSKNSKLIENLNISYCFHVTIIGISLILKGCKKLKLFCVTGCGYTDTAQISFQNACTGSIRILGLKNYGDLKKINDHWSNGGLSVIRNDISDDENNNEEDDDDGDDFW